MEQHESSSDLERLLAIASAPSEPNENLTPNDVEHFVAAVGITHGKEKIQLMVLWDRYKQWAKFPIPFVQFKRQFKAMFPLHRGGANHFYLLNKEPFNTSLEHLFKLRAERRAEKAKKANEKNKKKSV